MEPKGIITAMVTPLDTTNKIDPVATKQLVKRLLKKTLVAYSF